MFSAKFAPKVTITTYMNALIAKKINKVQNRPCDFNKLVTGKTIMRNVMPILKICNKGIAGYHFGSKSR